VIAVDTNLLVYAHRQDSPFHHRAAEQIRSLAESPSQWAIPWPCLHEFYSIVTHRRIYSPPSTLQQSIDQIEAWLASPSLVLLSESETHWTVLRALLADGQVVGPMVHDGRIAALCVGHGVRELWSADRDFGRFPRLRTRNPLI
jgi:toxin-antitoxin system PIN domain toxin